MPHAPAELAAQPSAGPQNRTQAAKSPAEWAYERIILYIRNFESQLDAQQEIAMGFAGNDAGVLRIEGLGFFEPDLLTFYGRDDDGMKTQLIQHVSQLSVMLRAVPKAAPEIPADPHRISACQRLDGRRVGRWLGVECRKTLPHSPRDSWR